CTRLPAGGRGARPGGPGCPVRARRGRGRGRRRRGRRGGRRARGGRRRAAARAGGRPVARREHPAELTRHAQLLELLAAHVGVRRGEERPRLVPPGVELEGTVADTGQQEVAVALDHVGAAVDLVADEPRRAAFRHAGRAAGGGAGRAGGGGRRGRGRGDGGGGGGVLRLHAAGVDQPHDQARDQRDRQEGGRDGPRRRPGAAVVVPALVPGTAAVAAAGRRGHVPGWRAVVGRWATGRRRAAACLGAGRRIRVRVLRPRRRGGAALDGRQVLGGRIDGRQVPGGGGDGRQVLRGGGGRTSLAGTLAVRAALAPLVRAPAAVAGPAGAAPGRPSVAPPAGSSVIRPLASTGIAVRTRATSSSSISVSSSCEAAPASARTVPSGPARSECPTPVGAPRLTSTPSSAGSACPTATRNV